MGGYNYLAIGNSITVHPITDFWWGEWGMAASDISKDYYHIILKHLLDEKENVHSIAWNYSVWEMQAHDRTETYLTLDKYLDNDLNLITVQLSENVSDIQNFELDFKSLVLHLQELCPKATIVVIDDFWNEEKGQIKKDICNELGVIFIDLSNIRGNEAYMVGLGTIVKGDKGELHTIEHSGVSVHPNDAGMMYIADKVIDEIN